MSPDYVIAVGTSAGGMPALTLLVEQLAGTLPAAVLVVQHLAPDSSGEHLVERLARHTTLRCHLAHHGEAVEAGHLYLAPPDQHLLVKDGHLLVVRGPHENRYRPAADTLFRAVAVAYGTRAIGVVLTGMLHDGTAGLEYIKRCGGQAVVQEPRDAEFPSMPESAVRNVAVDYVVPLAEMGALLTRLVLPATGAAPAAPVPADLLQEAAIAERTLGTTDEARALNGDLVPISCPDCGGSLWQLPPQGAEGVVRFRCHTGHAYTAAGLVSAGQAKLEDSLWVALRMLEERKTLLTNMAVRGEAAGGGRQQERVEEMKQHINRLRAFLLTGTAGGAEVAA